jgi:hypothetical protein
VYFEIYVARLDPPIDKGLAAIVQRASHTEFHGHIAIERCLTTKVTKSTKLKSINYPNPSCASW